VLVATDASPLSRSAGLGLAELLVNAREAVVDPLGAVIDCVVEARKLGLDLGELRVLALLLSDVRPDDRQCEASKGR